MVDGAVYFQALTFAELEQKAREIFGEKLGDVIFTAVPASVGGLFKAEPRKIPGEFSDGA